MANSTRSNSGARESSTEMSLIQRSLLALPFLGLAILASSALNIGLAASIASEQLEHGEIVWDNGKNRVPIFNGFYNVQWLDNIVSTANMIFMPSVYGYDALSRAQVISFLSDGGVLLSVWLLESSRAGDTPWFLRYPSVFALVAQVIGLGAVCPVYCFLSFVYGRLNAPVSGDTASGTSLVTLFPALLVGYYAPVIGMFFWPDLGERQAWLSLWQLYPVLVTLAHAALSIVHSLGTPSKGQPPLHKFSHDLLAIRVTIGLSVLVGAASWMWTLWTDSFAIPAIFLPMADHDDALSGLTAFCGQFLRWDEVFVFGSKLLWLAYLYADTAQSGVTKLNFWKLLVVAPFAIVTLGPGATLGLGWLWREEALAAEREKDVLMLEVQAKVDALLKANGA